MTPIWKYRELVAAFGSDAEVAEVIRAAGFDPPPVKTIAGWRWRNSIPAEWVPLLIEIAIERGWLDDLSQLKKSDSSMISIMGREAQILRLLRKVSEATPRRRSPRTMEARIPWALVEEIRALLELLDS